MATLADALRRELARWHRRRYQVQLGFIASFIAPEFAVRFTALATQLATRVALRLSARSAAAVPRAVARCAMQLPGSSLILTPQPAPHGNDAVLGTSGFLFMNARTCACHHLLLRFTVTGWRCVQAAGQSTACAHLQPAPSECFGSPLAATRDSKIENIRHCHNVCGYLQGVTSKPRDASEHSLMSAIGYRNRGVPSTFASGSVPCRSYMYMFRCETDKIGTVYLLGLTHVACIIIRHKRQ